MLKFVKDEEVVFCPDTTSILKGHMIGADGIIISRQTSKSKGKQRIKSVLIKWKKHRRGVSCFRLRGKKRAKSDAFTALFESKKRKTKEGDDSRFEEEAKHLHPISHCRDCPLRLRRFAAPCNMTKQEAIDTDGMGK